MDPCPAANDLRRGRRPPIDPGKGSNAQIRKTTLRISTGARQPGAVRKLPMDPMPSGEWGTPYAQCRIRAMDPMSSGPLARAYPNGRRFDGWRTSALAAGHDDWTSPVSIHDVKYRAGQIACATMEQYRNDRLTSRVGANVTASRRIWSGAPKSLDRGPQGAFYPRERPPSQTDRGLRRHHPWRSSASSPTGWAREACA